MKKRYPTEQEWAAYIERVAEERPWMVERGADGVLRIHVSALPAAAREELARRETRIPRNRKRRGLRP